MGETIRMTNTRVAIVGAGAIGSLFGGLLARAGNDVIFIGRVPHIETIKTAGLYIKGLLNMHLRNLKTMMNLKNKEDFDIIIMTVKAYDVKNASLEIKPFIGSDMPIIFLQNGIGVESEAAEVFTRKRIIRAATYCGASLDSPGAVTCTGLGETIMGKISKDGGKGLDDIFETFKSSGLPVKISNNIIREVWIKTLVNAGINPYGVLMRMRNGELLKSKELKWFMSETVREGVNVAERLRIRIEEDVVKLTFRTAEATAENMNSMLQDIRKGRRTEIDYINGAISQLGRKVSISTPLNSLLTFLIKNIEVESSCEDVYAVSPF